MFYVFFPNRERWKKINTNEIAVKHSSGKKKYTEEKDPVYSDIYSQTRETLFRN